MISVSGQELYEKAARQEDQAPLSYHRSWSFLTTGERETWMMLAQFVNKKLEETREEVRKEFSLTLLETQNDR